MNTKFSKIALSMLSFALALGLNFQTKPVSKAQADGNYITLSSYYLLPGQQLTVSGNGFSPNENVTVSVAGINQNTTASGSGQFTSPSFTIPFSAINSTQTVTASGNMGHTSSAGLAVGTFYPNVTPSSWYVVPGNTISFSGTGFAPNEQVTFSGNGVNGNVTAGGGSFGTNSFMVPYASGQQTYTFTGQTSHVSRSVTVVVASEPAYLLLSNYFGALGDPIQVSGFAFGSQENVTLTWNGAPFGTATSSGSGQFTFNSRVPTNFGGPKTITATGQQTGKSASATFTQSDFNPSR